MNPSIAVARSNFKCDLRHLVTQTMETMACYGIGCQYLAVSPALAELLQCPAEIWVGQTDLELIAQHPQSAEKRAYWQEAAEAVTAVLQTGQAEWRVHTVPTTEGEQHYETTYTPLRNEQDQLYQILSISRAIDLPPRLRSTSLDDSLVGIEMPGLETASLADLPTAPAKACRSDSVSGDTPKEWLTSREHSSLPLEAAPPTHQMAEFMQIVLDSIPQYIFWKNREGMYLGSNYRWAEMAGLGDSSRVAGITDDDLPWTPQQIDWYRQCDRQVMETDTPMLRIKESQRQADGQLGWREVNKFPLHDAAGNVVGLLGTIEDITERKIAEDLLKQSEATYRKLAKQGELLNQLSTQIRQSLDLAAIQQIAVDEVRELFAVDRALIYRFSSDWNGQVAVESVVKGCTSMLGTTGMNNQFHPQHVEQYRQGHIWAITDLSTAELDARETDYLQGLHVQAKLVVPILVQDTLWGLLIVHQCSVPRDWESDEIDLLRTLCGQLGVAIHQASLLARAERSAILAKEKAQQLETAMKTLKQAQSQLVQTEKMSSLGQMVAGIAHEINNPVNFIHGNLKHVEDYIRDLLDFLQLYEKHYPTPDEVIQTAAEDLDIDFVQTDLKKTLSSMRTGTERIREIVLSLRNFSRLDEVGCKSINIHEGIESTLLILQHRLKAQPNRPAIVVERDFGVLPPVQCFASQLNQVFMNILANAIDALESELKENPTAGKVPTITLRTEARDESIVVSLSDNGTGMPTAVRAQMFDPFFTTKAVGKGTGMGMAISYQIVVEKHNGQIECFSEEGIGTQFVITVPTQCQIIDEHAL